MYKNFFASDQATGFLIRYCRTELAKRKDMTETKVEQFLCLLSAEKRCSDWLSYSSNTNDVIEKI